VVGSQSGDDPNRLVIEDAMKDGKLARALFREPSSIAEMSRLHAESRKRLAEVLTHQLAEVGFCFEGNFFADRARVGVEAGLRPPQAHGALGELVDARRLLHRRAGQQRGEHGRAQFDAVWFAARHDSPRNDHHESPRVTLCKIRAPGAGLPHEPP
jgi:hypothetical protein